MPPSSGRKTVSGKRSCDGSLPSIAKIPPDREHTDECEFVMKSEEEEAADMLIKSCVSNGEKWENQGCFHLLPR